MATNGVPPAASWDRGYTPNASWSTAGPSPIAPEENQWNNGYPTVETYADSSFTFQQGGGGGFHPPAPVTVDPSTFVNGGGANGYRPRPSPQPQQIQIGGFSPHLSSPHPSPGSGQQQLQNGRCGSVPPHFDTANGYSPRPPSSNPPETAYRNGDANTGHQNGPPGYPSPVPQPQSTPWQEQPSSRGDQEPPNKRATPHEELNNRLKEKILGKQQQQQQQQYGQTGGNGQYYVNYNNGPYGGEEYGNGDGHFNPPSASSPAATNNVRLDVHVEQQQQIQQGSNSNSNSPAHFLGPAHPQSGGTGGGANQPGMTLTTDSNGTTESPVGMSNNSTSPPRNGESNGNSHCPTHSASAAAEEERLNKLKNNVKDEVPPCQCFPPDQCKSPVR